MLTINPSALRAPLPDNAPAPAPAGHEPSDPAGFSSLLRQSRVAVAPPPHEDTMTAAKADPAPEAEASPEANDTQATDTAAPAHTAPRAKLRSSDAAPRAAKPGNDTDITKAKPAEPSAVAPGQAAPTAPATPTTPLDPNVAQWLAAQQRPVIAAKAGDAAPLADPTTSELGGASTSAKTTRSDGTALDTDAKNKTGHVASRFAAAAEAAGLGAAGAATRTTEATPSSPTPAAAPAGGLLASPSLQTPQALREASAPAPVAIATPVNAPDFAQTLGVQLSVLAKDGIQQAELHLNPAEMGPVSVQIVMEGTQARIDFGADVAATRHAIEAGLPALASALRDAGFTLAGGGVSQHAGQRGEGRADDRGTQRGARTASGEVVAHVATAARRIVTQGGVDLYA